MQNKVKQIIEDTLGTSIVLEKPKDRTLGHFATPVAFSLAKELRKSPMLIADELASKFENSDIFEKVVSIKGFINFTLKLSFLETIINQALKDKANFAKGNSKNQKILLEYVSANPTGPLHIGHARGAIFGNALYTIGNHLGYDVVSEYYVNDAGSQMDLLGLSLYLAGRESILKVDVEYPQQYYRGDYLFDLANEAVVQYGKTIFEDESNISTLALFAKDKVLKIITDDLKDLGVEFDNFVYEKPLYSKWNDIKTQLENNDSLYTKDEKVWLKSTKQGDELDRVVIRENGIPTYLAGDIIYHKDKYDRGYDKFINIWGADHHGYIARVKSAIKFLNNDPAKLEVLLSQMVSLLKGGQPYKMSKRAGNVILMSDITKEIGADALRFIFLTKKSDTHLEFDIDTLKNNDSSNPIFYINYAHARIHQIFKKANVQINSVEDLKLDDIDETATSLLFEALLLPKVLNEAFDKREVQKVTEYLHSLSALLHKFYNETKIVDSSNQDSYLKILAMVALSIKTGLKLLGIDAKETM
jgi:arginyl-tRNA synthetase